VGDFLSKNILIPFFVSLNQKEKEGRSLDLCVQSISIDPLTSGRSANNNKNNHSNISNNDKNKTPLLDRAQVESDNE
jgi:hypothetical protein